MNYPSEIRLATPAVSLNALMEPHRQWIENVLGCETSDVITFEVEMPFGQLVTEDILKGAILDRQCLSSAAGLRSVVARWELPPGIGPKMKLFHSREQNSPITAKTWAWDPHWQETPIAVWFQGLKHALVAASIPYVTYSYGPQNDTKDWLLVNRAEIASTLNLLSSLVANRPKKVVKVIGGKDIPLPLAGFDWDMLALDPQILELVKQDLEFFFQREDWFRRSGLPFRRGYLFYGPPGNGKTSAIRAMASHPATRSFSLDFSNEELHNDALTELFEAASHAAPSLVIFEDLDRLYGTGETQQNRTKITLQHLLNCLDGLGTAEGTIVVATANDPEALDPAILRRPGRFDRVVQFPVPSALLRGEYIAKLTAGRADCVSLKSAVNLSDGFSFAQIRESYILAGQFAFRRGDDEIYGEDLLEGIKTIRSGPNGIGGRLGKKETGFAPLVQTSQS